MKLFKVPSLYVAIFLMFVSCDANEIIDIESKFISGESNAGYISIKYDDIRPLCSMREHYPDIDLNNDGEIDLFFDCGISQSSGGYSLSESIIKIKNDAFEVLGEEVIDSVRVCYFYNLNNLQDTVWNRCIYNNHTDNCRSWCSDLRADSLLYTEEVKIVTKFEKGDTIPNNSNWISGNGILGHHNTSGHEPSLSVNGVGTKYDVLRGKFTDESSAYIIVRFKYNTNYKYGWINISTSSSWLNIWSEGFSVKLN